MDLEKLRETLLGASRSNSPSDRVPYAFEKRVLARLKETPALDASALWARALWRAAASCVALTLLLAVWSLIGAQNSQPASVAASNDGFSQQFEQTMLAAINDSEEVW